MAPPDGGRGAVTVLLTVGMVGVVALSMNQLILSRVFDPPGQLFDRVDGDRDLRECVRRYADVSVTPTDPREFLVLAARTVRDRADRLDAVLRAGRWDPPAEIDDYVHDVGAYGANLAAAVKAGDSVSDILDVVVGTEYAENLAATEAVRNGYGDRLSPVATAQLWAIDELLESVAVTR